MSTDPAPDRPRLGIIHLMLWAACVGVSLGVFSFRMILPPADQRTQPIVASNIVLMTLLGIGAGAGLAGLILAIVWRRRGIVFPVSPGEHIWVAWGMLVVLRFFFMVVQEVVFTFVAFDVHRLTRPAMILARVPSIGLLLGVIAVWFLVRSRVKVRRWRRFIEGLAALVLLALLSMYFFPISVSPLVVVLLGAGGLLTGVVVRDHQEGKRYPWTHWTGVAVVYWVVMVGLQLCVVYVLIR